MGLSGEIFINLADLLYIKRDDNMFQGLSTSFALENTASDLSKCMLNYKYQEKGKEKKTPVFFLSLILFQINL